MRRSLEKEIWINASPKKVFACFTDAEQMLSWHGKQVETNPTPGGIYRLVFENGDEINGIFKEVTRYSKVVYSANYAGVESVVTINLIPQNDGTLVKLRQVFSDQEDLSSFDHGWDYFLGLLAEKFAQSL